MSLQATIDQIAQRHSNPLYEPWTCSACHQPQPSDDQIDGMCLDCCIAMRDKQLPLTLQDTVRIPRKFASQDWTLPAWAEPYLHAKADRGLCLTGGAGVGKTVTLCLLARNYLRAQIAEGINPQTVHVWRFLSFPAFVMELQDAWRRDGEQTAWDLLKQAAQTPRLIVDDLGAEKLTDYIRQATYYLLNEREQWEKPTYLTTNFSLAELDRQFDSRISSRIAGMCDLVALQGKDRRLGIAKHA